MVIESIPDVHLKGGYTITDYVDVAIATLAHWTPFKEGVGHELKSDRATCITIIILLLLLCTVLHLA